MTTASRVLFIGSKRLGLQCLSEIHSLQPHTLAAIMTLDDRNDTRSVFDELQSFAEKKGIRFLVAKNKNDSENLIYEIKPDFCIVVGWYWIFSAKILNAVKNGFVGIHNSLLPKYRGGSPLVWAIINGEGTVGTSLFSMSEGVDNGDIWGQRSIRVGPDEYISDILAKLESEAVSLLREKYVDLVKGRLKPVKQNEDEATYCAQRLPDDGLINWEKSSTDIYNFIRAQSEPYPGAFTLYDGKKLTIWRARPENVIYYGTAGQVAKVNENGVYVICGDYKPIILGITELEGTRNKEPANKIIKSFKTRFPNHTVYQT